MIKWLNKKSTFLNKVALTILAIIFLCISMRLDMLKSPRNKNTETAYPVVERIVPNLPQVNYLNASAVTTFNGVTIEYENELMNGYQIDDFTVFFSEGRLDEDVLFDDVAIEGKGVVAEKLYTNSVNDTIIQNSFITYYEYDANNRITKEITNNYEREYEYDSAGRLTYIKQGDKTLTAYVYNGDQLQFYYDYENRLVYEYLYDNASGKVTNILTYKYENNLLFMQLDSDVPTTQNPYNNGFIITETNHEYQGELYVTKRTVGGKIYEYSYINNIIVREKVLDTLSLQAYTIYYIYDNTLERVGFTIAGEVYYYKYDILGNVESILNADGNIVGSYKYSPHGSFIASGIFADLNPYTFRASHNWIYDNTSNQYFIGANTIYDVNTLSFVNEVHKHFTFDPINYSVINGKVSTKNILPRKEGLKKETYIAERVAEVVAQGLAYENVPSVLNMEVFHTSTNFMLPRASIYTIAHNTNESLYYSDQVYYISQFGTASSERNVKTVEFIDNDEEVDFAFAFMDELVMPVSGELGFYGHFVYLDEYVLYTSTEYGLIEFILLENEWQNYEEDFGNLFNYDTNKYSMFFGIDNRFEFIEVVSNVLASINWNLIQQELNAALSEFGIINFETENIQFNSYVTDIEHYETYIQELSNNHDIPIVMGYNYDELANQFDSNPWLFVDGGPKTLAQIKSEQQRKLLAMIQVMAGYVLLPFAPGLGIMMIAGGVVSIASDSISPKIGTAFQGLTSIMNGIAAITTGVSVITLGPIGIVIGGLAITAGAGTVGFGANDLNLAITGNNFIADLLKLNEETYMALNITFNIASTVLNIAGNLHKSLYKPNPRVNTHKNSIYEESVKEFNEQNGTNFNNYAEFKKHYGPAGPGMEWHHIVEQKTAQILGLESNKVYSKLNTIALTKAQHIEISRFYSTKNHTDFGGLPPRAFMRVNNWSFEQQFEYGRKVLEKILGIII